MLKRTFFAMALAISVWSNVFSAERDNVAVKETAERGAGYGFLGMGSVYDERMLHFGFGGDLPLYKGIGLGGEIGYLGAAEYLRSGFGLGSINGTYQFAN